MRIAIVSDIHGNLTAFEAVLADVRQMAPDLVFHGGDLADSGSSPLEIVDRIRELGWPGVVGNTDEMLFRPESLAEHMNDSPLRTMLEEMSAATREALGEERLAWLRALPSWQTHGSMLLVHAAPGDSWRVPAHDDFEAVSQPLYVYGHIHRPYIESIAGKLVANTGSVSLSYDGDSRASYLLIDDGQPSIRRVAYDIEQELKLLDASGLPHTEWIKATFR